MQPANRLRQISRRTLAALTTPHPVATYRDAVWPAADGRARIAQIDHPTADAVTLHLTPPRGWRGHRAGQFVPVTVEVDGVRRTRCFSPVNAAQDTGRIELTIKAHDDGCVSRHLKHQARVGDRIEIGAPAGDFHLPATSPAHVLLISGGSGITPVLSMLRTLLADGHTGRIDFVHYNRTPADVIARDELANLAREHGNLTVRTVFTASDAGDARGHCSHEQIGNLVPDFADAMTWLCGPDPMMDAVADIWDSAGAGDRLFTERFAPAASPAADLTTPATGELRFARSERLAANSGDTLLEQAEAAGLRPAFGCRMGICASCTCRKTAGVVRNVQTGVVSSADAEDIRLCVTAPVGTVTLDL